jgi:hypothetical protein
MNVINQLLLHFEAIEKTAQLLAFICLCVYQNTKIYLRFENSINFFIEAQKFCLIYKRKKERKISVFL